MDYSRPVGFGWQIVGDKNMTFLDIVRLFLTNGVNVSYDSIFETNDRLVPVPKLGNGSLTFSRSLDTMYYSVDNGSVLVTGNVPISLIEHIDIRRRVVSINTEHADIMVKYPYGTIYFTGTVI